MNFKRLWREKKPEDSARRSVEFDLMARAEDSKSKLRFAQEIALKTTHTGQIFDREGYSTGGFTGSIVTASGRPDGPPKMDPVTVSVADKAGAPLFTIEITTPGGKFAFAVKGATPAIQEKLEQLPPECDDPVRQVEAVMSALTPESEIGAAIATVKQGALVFQHNGMDPGTRAGIEQGRQQRRDAAEAEKLRQAVDEATVLQAPTTVGVPLRLKTPKA